MATFRDRAVHSVYRMFSLSFGIVILFIVNFDFEGETLVLIAPVPGHCLILTFNILSIFIFRLVLAMVYHLVFSYLYWISHHGHILMRNPETELF